jgi:hypothetical protein
MSTSETPPRPDLSETPPRPDLPNLPAAPDGLSSVVVGRGNWKEQLEEWGMVPAFDDDDPFDKRVRGY